jgi:hypothetical protein
VVRVAEATAAARVWATATASSKATAIVRAQAGTLLIFEIQSVTVLADQSDGLDGKMEFFMHTAISDNENNTSIFYPRQGGAIPVSAGQIIPLGQFNIAIDEERIVGDELTINITAVDVDDQSADEELLELLVEFAIEYGTLSVGSKLKKLDRAIPPLRYYIEQANNIINNYFDLIGKEEIILRRSENWRAGQLVNYRREDGGIEFTYRVYLTDKVPLDPAELGR